MGRRNSGPPKVLPTPHGPVVFDIPLETPDGKVRLRGDLGAVRRLHRQLNTVLAGYEQLGEVPSHTTPYHAVSTHAVGTFVILD